MELLDFINPYSWVMALRKWAFDCGRLPGRAFDVPVICVGNITLGGTGKTPHIEYIINLLKDDYAVATLSRGYRRTTKGFRIALPGSDALLVGDEPSQIKKKFPQITVAVDEKRVDGIENLLREKPAPEVILLDDAFQHRYVKPGLSIVLVDYNRPVWRDNVLPFGRLRESARGIRRADVVVMTKCPPYIDEKERQSIVGKLRMRQGAQLFFSTVCYDGLSPLFNPSLEGCKIEKGTAVLLLTGIARPQPMKEELERRGAVVTLMRYADHHNFSKDELEDIARKFSALPSDDRLVVTTEKDAERLAGRTDLPAIIKENICSLPIKIKIIDEENRFNQIIKDYVRENSRDRGILAVGDED